MPNELNKYSEAQLSEIKQAWDRNLLAGSKSKEAFTNDGQEIMQFYCTDHTSTFANDVTNSKNGFGWFKQATINKTHEGVQVIGSHLYEQAPARRVNPRGANENEAFAGTLQKYQNYTAIEMDLRRHGKAALHEGLIFGRGCLWTEISEQTGLIYSKHQPIEDVLIDPDTRTIEDTWWIARFMRQPRWKLKRRFGDIIEKVPGGAVCKFNEGIGDGESKDDDATSSQDLIGYWEIYSKMGDGRRIKKKDAPNDDKIFDDGRKNDYKMIVLCPQYEHPLYIGNWPTPFWADARSMGWPAAFCEFAIQPNKAWPFSIFKPGLPLQKWLNWAYSFTLKKIRSNCREILLVSERLNDKQRATLRNDAQADLEVMLIDDNQADDIRKIAQVLQFPPMNGDILTAINMAQEQYARVTGLYDLLYGGGSSSMRSAEEARLKGQNSRSRIDDMVNEVASFHTMAARHEAIAARFHVPPVPVITATGKTIDNPKSIYTVLGEQDAQIWGAFKFGDLSKIVGEYDYAIAAGSMHVKTPRDYIAQTNEMMDILATPLYKSGSYTQVNNLITEWCEARNIRNPGKFHIQIAVIDGREVTPTEQQMLLDQMREAETAAQQQAQEAEERAQKIDPSAAQMQMSGEAVQSRENIAAAEIQSTERLKLFDLMAKGTSNEGI